ncbi:response regulator [Desulfospira joergensenii]|uniref:response regulator n=1 Tax=Desulfospira joergensenii TaxID=53329 RepID=UPI0003B72686|nr:response regulator [Desulfospira joergensenii]
MSSPEFANILIVDDEPNNLSVLRQMLSAQGYKVRPITNGRTALQAAETLVPDLILLDIMMPGGLDGFTVCRKLKQMEQIKDVPVIFLSALDDTENKVLAFETGGVDYITKPFEQSEVLTRVKTHILLYQSQKDLKEKNQDLAKMNQELKQAMDEIKTLKGILPICSYCKKIRDDQGNWNYLETYIENHSEASMTHGMCPECSDKLYGKEDWYVKMKAGKKKSD